MRVWTSQDKGKAKETSERLWKNSQPAMQVQEYAPKGRPPMDISFVLPGKPEYVVFSGSEVNEMDKSMKDDEQTVEDMTKLDFSAGDETMVVGTYQGLLSLTGQPTETPVKKSAIPAFTPIKVPGAEQLRSQFTPGGEVHRSLANITLGNNDSEESPDPQDSPTVGRGKGPRYSGRVQPLDTHPSVTRSELYDESTRPAADPAKHVSWAQQPTTRHFAGKSANEVARPSVIQQPTPTKHVPYQFGSTNIQTSLFGQGFSQKIPDTGPTATSQETKELSSVRRSRIRNTYGRAESPDPVAVAPVNTTQMSAPQ